MSGEAGSGILEVVAYDGETGRLEVIVASGERYLYYDVPPNIHQTLLGSQNRHEYFNANVWNKYEYRAPCRDLKELFDSLV